MATIGWTGGGGPVSVYRDNLAAALARLDAVTSTATAPVEEHSAAYVERRLADKLVASVRTAPRSWVLRNCAVAADDGSILDAAADVLAWYNETLRIVLSLRVGIWRRQVYVYNVVSVRRKDDAPVLWRALCTTLRSSALVEEIWSLPTRQTLAALVK